MNVLTCHKDKSRVYKPHTNKQKPVNPDESNKPSEST